MPSTIIGGGKQNILTICVSGANVGATYGVIYNENTFTGKTSTGINYENDLIKTELYILAGSYYGCRVIAKKDLKAIINNEIQNFTVNQTIIDSQANVNVCRIL